MIAEWSRLALLNHWRSAPTALPGAYRGQLLSVGFEDAKERWCRDLPSRLFCLTPTDGVGRSRAFSAGTTQAAIDLFEHYRRQGEALTLLCNGAERNSFDINALRTAFGSPANYRIGDVVATFSLRTSGIGYHAGAEDSVILQVAGERRWRVWSGAVIPGSYRRMLCGVTPDMEGLDRSPLPAMLDVTLRPGDMLYIPPFFAHEGETIADSVSLGFSWRGVTAYHLLKDDLNDLPLSHNSYDALFEVLPDAHESEVVDVWTSTSIERAHGTVNAKAAGKLRARIKAWLELNGRDLRERSAAPR